MCKGDLENKKTTFMVELDNCIIIIKNVLFGAQNKFALFFPYK